MVNNLVGVTTYGYHMKKKNEEKAKVASEATKPTLRTRHWTVVICVVSLFY